MKTGFIENPTLVFFRSAGAVLLVTALAKLVSSFGQAPILNLRDPILPLSFRNVFIAVGALELVVAGYCFFGKNAVLRAATVAALASSMVGYRLGLMWIGYHRPCPCLGDFTDMLRIPEAAADMTLKVVLGYLWCGSVGLLIWLWYRRQNPVAEMETTSVAY